MKIIFIFFLILLFCVCIFPFYVHKSRKAFIDEMVRTKTIEEIDAKIEDIRCYIEEAKVKGVMLDMLFDKSKLWNEIKQCKLKIIKDEDNIS